MKEVQEEKGEGLPAVGGAGGEEAGVSLSCWWMVGGEGLRLLGIWLNVSRCHVG